MPAVKINPTPQRTIRPIPELLCRRTEFPGGCRFYADGGYTGLSMPTLIDVTEIRQILPHRYPFLLVDRIVELSEDRIVGIKNVTANEPFFQGHFPDFPVMPGVLIVEAMAQTAGVHVLRQLEDRANMNVFLVSVDAARFRRPVVPGDQLRMEMTVIKRKGTVAKMAGKALVDGLVVAEAEVMCKLERKPVAPGKGDTPAP